MCPHMVESTEQALVPPSPFKGTNPIVGTPPHDLIQTQLPPKDPTSKYHYIGEKTVSSINGAGKTGQLHVKE